MTFDPTARAALAALCAVSFLSAAPAIASADPEPDPAQPDTSQVATPAGDPAPGEAVAPAADVTPGEAVDDGPVNVTYRARVDGLARGARVLFRSGDTELQSADPTMLPGRTFEAMAALTDRDLAGMEVSVDLPYSANLHCEILIDDQIVAQADHWVAPRLTRPKDDPDYGKLTCGTSPMDSPVNLPGPAPIAEPDAEPAPDAPAA